MILYINGDSHSAGAEAVNAFCFAEDDPRYQHQRRRPHPDNLEVCFGKVLSRILNFGFAIDAESAASNDRILRTTKEFVEKKSKRDIFLLIGWTTPEREEWLHQDQYYQVNASGIDSVPEELQEKYKHFVANCNGEHYTAKQIEWSNKIYEFHLELNEQNIKHLFFDTFTNLKRDYDYGENYVQEIYYNYLKEQGFNTKTADSYHFDKRAHTKWANHLISYLQKLI